MNSALHPILFMLGKKNALLCGWLKWHHFSSLTLHPNNSGITQQLRTGLCVWIQITPPLLKERLPPLCLVLVKMIADLLFIMFPLLCTLSVLLYFALWNEISVKEQLVFVHPPHLNLCTFSTYYINIFLFLSK